MSNEEILKFPCSISIKALGRIDTDLENVVMEIISHHFTDQNTKSVRTKPSSKGNYLSVSVTVVADSRQQMDAVYQELSDCKQVVMAL